MSDREGSDGTAWSDHRWALDRALVQTVVLVLVDVDRVTGGTPEDGALVVLVVFVLSFCLWGLVLWASGGRWPRWTGERE